MTNDTAQRTGERALLVKATLTESYTDIFITALCKKFRTFGISINLNMLGEIAHKWQV